MVDKQKSRSRKISTIQLSRFWPKKKKQKDKPGEGEETALSSSSARRITVLQSIKEAKLGDRRKLTELQRQRPHDPDILDRVFNTVERCVCNGNEYHASSSFDTTPEDDESLLEESVGPSGRSNEIAGHTTTLSPAEPTPEKEDALDAIFNVIEMFVCNHDNADQRQDMNKPFRFKRMKEFASSKKNPSNFESLNLKRLGPKEHPLKITGRVGGESCDQHQEQSDLRSSPETTATSVEGISLPAFEVFTLKKLHSKQRPLSKGTKQRSNLSFDTGQQVQQAQKKIICCKIRKGSREERTGLSFVSFYDKPGIYVSDVKEMSKFQSKIKPGMRVLEVNGRQCPDRVRDLMHILRSTERHLAITAGFMSYANTNQTKPVRRQQPRQEHLPPPKSPPKKKQPYINRRVVLKRKHPLQESHLPSIKEHPSESFGSVALSNSELTTQLIEVSSSMEQSDRLLHHDNGLKGKDKMAVRSQQPRQQPLPPPQKRQSYKTVILSRIHPLQENPRPSIKDQPSDSFGSVTSVNSELTTATQLSEVASNMKQSVGLLHRDKYKMSTRPSFSGDTTERDRLGLGFADRFLKSIGYISQDAIDEDSHQDIEEEETVFSCDDTSVETDFTTVVSNGNKKSKLAPMEIIPAETTKEFGVPKLSMNLKAMKRRQSTRNILGRERVDAKAWKQRRRDKLGISFVSFKQKKGVYIYKISERSKFFASGLKPGMEICFINGGPCPETVADTLKKLKETRGELTISAYRYVHDEVKAPEEHVRSQPSLQHEAREPSDVSSVIDMVSRIDRRDVQKLSKIGWKRRRNLRGGYPVVHR